MKKCSVSHHHALAELNITPLLDLAFVLLVIFIITTTPIVNDLEVDLPKAANRPKESKPKVHYVTVERTGTLYLDKDSVDLAELLERVIGLRTGDPDLSVVVRASARAKYKSVVAVMDRLQQANVGRVDLATDPAPDGAARKE